MAAPLPPILPVLRDTSAAGLQRWADDLVRALSTELAALRTPAGDTAYTVTNGTPSRTLDATAATLAELRQVVAALIADLQSKGSIS